MKVLRTPGERFKDLADYPFEPHYTNIVTDDGTELQLNNLCSIHRGL